LPYDRWKDTYATLHRVAQIVGKVKLALTPRQNHFWNVAFSVTPRGLTTGRMTVGTRSLAIDLDLVDHNLVVRASPKETRALALVPRAVADSYHELMLILGQLGVEPRLNDRPVELQEDPFPLSEDRAHASYDPAPVQRCLAVLQHVAGVLDTFRAGYVGKASPVQFYWGTFDLCTSRYSGRRAPLRPGADLITRESYSHEVYSCGFWPGDRRVPEPSFFAYTAPAPAGFAEARVQPGAARWEPSMGEFLLPYESIRRLADPRPALLAFFQSVYEAAAELGRWDRDALERTPPAHPIQPAAPTLH
jgi:hypothetical protein